MERDFQTLEQFIIQENFGQIQLNQIFDYTIELLISLYSYHKQNKIHKRISPETVVFVRERMARETRTIAKIIDPPYQREIEPEGDLLSTCESQNLVFISPELLEEEPTIDSKVDIWSLGVIIYELMTSRIPWFNPDLSNEEIYQRVLTDEFIFSFENKDIRLVYLIRLMVKLDPARRPNIKDILKIDFVYERAVELIDKFKWEENENIKGIKELQKEIKQVHIHTNIVDETELKWLIDAKMLYEYCDCVWIRKSLLSSKCYAANGNELLKTYKKILDWNLSSDFKEFSREELIKTLFTKKLLLPLNLPQTSNAIRLTKEFLKTPNNYYITFTFNEGDPSIDNNTLGTFTSFPKNINSFILLSQRLIGLGKYVCYEIVNNISTLSKLLFN